MLVNLVNFLQKENSNRIKEIRDQQHRNMELVKNEYIEAIENIGKAKDIERETISKATGQTEKLNKTLEIMKVTMSEIDELKIKLENNNDESNRNKETLLKHQVEELKGIFHSIINTDHSLPVVLAKFSQT